MALSANQYIGDGVNTDFTLDFTLGYLRESHIHVFVDDVEIPQNTLTFTLGGGAVRVPTPPSAGTIVLVRRITPKGSLIHDYTDGALIIEKHLDESNLQPIMLMHEALDGFADAPQAALLDMGNNRITNVAPATLGTDVPNLEQVSGLLALNAGTGVLPQLQPRQIADGISLEYLGPHTEGALASSFSVQWDGITQRPFTDFTVGTAGLVTFTTVAPAGVAIDVTYFEPNTLEPDDVNRGVIPKVQARQVGDGSTLIFAAPHTKSASPASFFIQLNGVTQRPTTDYLTPTLSQINFTTPPPNGAVIDITYFEPNVLSPDVFMLAPPIAGTYDTTARIYNSNPVVGTPIGWVCIAGGNPGTWASFGTILA